MFTDNIHPSISSGVSTMGAKYLISTEIGTVIWCLTDDQGHLDTKILNNVIYFTDPPVNILSETALAESVKYDEVTWLPTDRKIIFYWRFWEVQKYNISLRTLSSRNKYPIWLQHLFWILKEWDQFQDVPHLTFPLPPL